MGRIRQSLIMPGQRPYCSLFSVCQADGGLLSVRLLCVHLCVCVHKYTLCKMGQGNVWGKRTPPYLIHHPTPSLTSMPLQIGFYITEAVRYEQLIFLFVFFPPFHSFTRLFCFSPFLYISLTNFFPEFIPSVLFFLSILLILRQVFKL